ncbi:hypothetical protein GCM10010156_20630 [Planobispora rosea]|uniref:Uncharacterized protein n=1 Tax=Planobispora rosea TaxID=35762 RepID=A0A8J3WG60_PLARO|nr:hypothetical protein [Planobispora rosea]GGS61787.1 hypothetical protein GCM10010156_20630 [Planobispora rosea]GIH86566.1 hypothetical protein Pro02_49740 [Planobispora rosea]
MALRTFAPGVEIFPVAGETVLRTPSGEFLRVNRELGDDPDRMDPETLGAFEARGLVTAPGPSRWPGPVTVVGDGAIAAALRGLLDRMGAEVIHADDLRPSALDPDLSPADCAAVVWCCDGHPPEAWATLDTLLTRRGIAWQRCSVEGATIVIEPVALGPDDVTHADVRARRLAASESPEHLLAYWTASGEDRRRGPSPIGPAQAAFVAALLAADLADQVGGADGAGRRAAAGARRLRLVDSVELTVTDHPILPLPPVEPRRSA